MQLPSKELVNLLATYTNIVNLNTVLPARSKKQAHVQLRDEIVKLTSFLPDGAELRERLWYISNNTSSSPLCETCGDQQTKWDKNTKQFGRFCSSRCTGTNSKVVLQKQNTCMSNHGVNFPAQSARVRTKYKQTMVQKYGCEYVNQHKVSESSRRILNSGEALSSVVHGRQLSTFDVASELGVSQATVSRYMSHHNIEPRVSSLSSFQRDLIRTISSFVAESDVRVNVRDVIAPLELDIYIPSMNLAFECDGLFWHSEVSGKKDRQYHVNKTNKCREQGIRLIHVFESDWTLHRSAVTSRIRSLLQCNVRIGARECHVRRVTPQVARAFCDVHHIQGYVNSSIHYGAFVNDEMVSCMCFAKPRFNTKESYELTRFCSTSGITLVGGANKIFTTFVRDVNPPSVISYCDLRWGTGVVYQHIGFKYSHTSTPNYWYYKGNKIYSRVKFQKHKLESQLKTFNPVLSEWNNMRLNGYDRIWDCGNSVWVWTG